MPEGKERRDGCVTNFEHDDGQMTIWKMGDRFTLAPFGVFQELHPWTYDPVFQSIAKEVHRLACEVGKLRRREIEIRRELLAYLLGMEDDNAIVNGSPEHAIELLRSALDRIIPEAS